MHHRGAAIEIMGMACVPAMAEQARRSQIHHDACRRGPCHRSAHQRLRVVQPLDGFHYHHRGGHRHQHAIAQGRQLGAAPEAVGEAFIRRAGTEAFRAPAQGQPRHIAQVVQGIADQCQ